MQLFRAALLSLVLPLALGACDDAPGLEPDEEVELRQWVSCPKCQHNAAEVNGVPLGYLDLTGEPNEEGISVDFLRTPGGDIYDFGVSDDEEIVAYEGGQAVASGSELIGWELVLMIDAVRVPIRITSREARKSLAKNEGPISVYGLEVTGEDEKLSNICPGQPSGTASVTLLFGETYDGTRKLIDKLGPQYVTLACAGDAIFKVKHMGYGPRGHQGPGGTRTTPGQRTATLKMITADYCGTGQSFTFDGNKLLWFNASKTVVTDGTGSNILSPTVFMYEAVWTEKGAACIGKPRAVNGYGLSAHCKLPDCVDYLAGSPDPYEWKTLVSYLN